MDRIIAFIHDTGWVSKDDVLRAFPEYSRSAIEHALADLCREGSLFNDGHTPRKYYCFSLVQEGEY